MHSCDDFILAIRRNFMHMEGSGTIAELSAHDLGLGPGDDFEILLGGEGDEPNRVPLPDGALSVSIREYYFDWQPRRAGDVHHRVPRRATVRPTRVHGRRPRGSGSPRRPPTCTARSRTGTSTCSTRAPARPTTSSPAATTSRAGSTAANYAFCFFDLAPDEALVVDCDIPDSRYWSFHLYNLAWWEALEYAKRVTSLNHTQTRVSSRRTGPRRRRPRRIRASPTGSTPRAGARHCSRLRWFWPLGDPPSPSTRVVKLADVRAALPADTPAVDAAERRREIQRRRDHLAWRFRS